MNEESLRPRFELWAGTEFTHPFLNPNPLERDPKTGDYVREEVQTSWVAWVASRADAYKENLPTPMRPDPIGLEEQAADLWKGVDGDMREGGGIVTYHVAAFRQGVYIGESKGKS